jgi:hypothetical protein
MPEIPPGVIVEGDMLGKVASLKFVDHAITDVQKFPEMAQDKYLCQNCTIDKCNTDRATIMGGKTTKIWNIKYVRNPTLW